MTIGAGAIGCGAISGADGGAAPPPLVLGSAVVGLRVHVAPIGAASARLRVAVLPADIASGAESAADQGDQAAVWGVRVDIDDVDFSDYVIGDVVVEAEESAARVADLSIWQPPGTVIRPAEWSGRHVRIYFGSMGLGGFTNPVLLFSGVVDTPTVTPFSREIGLRCTDNRQGVLAALTKPAIDALLPDARYSPAVFQPGTSSLQYCNDLLSTVPQCIDLSPRGDLRSTPWEAKATPDFVLTSDDVLADSVVPEVAGRNGMVNVVDIEFSYRFPRVKSEGYVIDYDFLALAQTSFGYWVRDGNTFMVRASIESAIQAAGGNIVSIQYIPLPTTSQIIPGSGGEPAGSWLPNPLTDPLLCLGFEAVVSFDYAQDNEETHNIRVACSESVAKVGMIRSEMHGALQGVYDDTVAVEQNILLYRREVTRIPPKNLASVVVGVTNSVTGTLTPDTNRAAAEKAIETLIAVAETTIHAGHRASRVRFSMPCNPVMDVDKTVSLDADGVTAIGKVRSVKHRLSAESGSAISEVELALCSTNGVGVDAGSDTIVYSAGSADGVTNTLAAPTVTWDGSMTGNQVVTITFPGVEAAERAKAAHVFESDHRTVLPEDLMEIVL